jgi:tetratricopeptide (TPR) repeat protein
MGTIYDLHGLTVQAAAEYQQAIVYDPTSFKSRLRFGANLTRLGRFEEAIEQLTRVGELDPDDIQARYLLALIYSSLKKFDNAALQYESILNSLASDSPDNANLYFYLGQLYYARRDYNKAIEQFNKVLTLQPQNTEMMYFLGALYVEIERGDKAIETFKNALKIDPDHDGVLNSLGFIYAEQGNNLEEAMRLVQRALVIAPDSAAYMDSLGWVYFKQGRYDEALKILLKANDLMKDPVILEHIGDVYLALKNPQEAKRYWKKSIEINPDQKSVKDKIDRLDNNSSGETVEKE